MGKPKAKYVSATPTPEQARVQQNLGNFLAQYGTQMRGMYPGQLNAGMNPFLNMAGNMLSGMYGFGGGGQTGMPGQQPTPINMTWNWPTMPTSFYTQQGQQAMQPPVQPPAPAKPEEKKGPKIFGIGSR